MSQVFTACKSQQCHPCQNLDEVFRPFVSRIVARRFWISSTKLRRTILKLGTAFKSRRIVVTAEVQPPQTVSTNKLLKNIYWWSHMCPQWILQIILRLLQGCLHGHVRAWLSRMVWSRLCRLSRGPDTHWLAGDVIGANALGCVIFYAYPVTHDVGSRSAWTDGYVDFDSVQCYGFCARCAMMADIWMDASWNSRQIFPGRAPAHSLRNQGFRLSGNIKKSMPALSSFRPIWFTIPIAGNLA